MTGGSEFGCETETTQLWIFFSERKTWKVGVWGVWGWIGFGVDDDDHDDDDDDDDDDDVLLIRGQIYISYTKTVANSPGGCQGYVNPRLGHSWQTIILYVFVCLLILRSPFCLSLKKTWLFCLNP